MYHPLLATTSTVFIMTMIQVNHIAKSFTFKASPRSLNHLHGVVRKNSNCGGILLPRNQFRPRPSSSTCVLPSFSSSTKSVSSSLTAHEYISTRTCTRLFTSTTDSTSSETTKNNIQSDEEQQKQKQIVQHMLYRIRECNQVPQEVNSNLMDFILDGQKVGKVTEKVAQLLCDSSPDGRNQVFEVGTESNSSSNNSNFLTLTKEAGSTVEERSDAVMDVMENLRSKGAIKGWRDELLPLSGGFYDEPVLLVERAAAPFLGMQQYGVHINGIIKTEDGTEKMWIARRSKSKSKYPGMLDHIVAGGQPAGLGLMENVLKECAEEAGISEEITLAGIQATGAVSYEAYEPSDDENGEYDGVITRCLLFNYDLYLPHDFKPKVVDGEVEDFFTWDIDEILESMDEDYPDPIKPNCYLVIIDFLLRKGYLSPEVPGYLDIMRELRGGYCG